MVNSELMQAMRKIMPEIIETEDPYTGIRSRTQRDKNHSSD